MEAHKEGTDRPFVAPEHDRSEQLPLPGWEWLRELAVPRRGFALSLSRQPWTLFGEVSGPLTVVTNGWFMLSIAGDVGYPVAAELEAPQIRELLRCVPKAPARVFHFDLFRAFLGLSAADAPCGRCSDSGRASCTACTRHQRMEFAPPCHICEGRGRVPCPECVVVDDPHVDAIRIGVGVFNRAVVAPVVRRLRADHVEWCQADRTSPATIRARDWLLVLAPLKWECHKRLPAFPALEIAA